MWFVSVIKPAIQNQTGPTRTISSTFCVPEIEKPFQEEKKKREKKSVFGLSREKDEAEDEYASETRLENC